MTNDLRLREIDVMNSMELEISVVESMTLPGSMDIIDAEGDLVCTVPDNKYKDWSHALTIKELLTWAAENYPYRQVE